MFAQTTINRQQLRTINKDHPNKMFGIRVAEVESRLIDLGAVKYDMNLPETKVLPYIIHPDEEILGVVYGRYKKTNTGEVGRGMLLATNRRALLIDKKPMFLKFDEVTYRVVSAVTYGRVGPIGNVTLHTRMGDVIVRTFNQKLAQGFIEAIEGEIFKSNITGEVYDYK